MSQKASRRLRGRPKLPGKPKFIRVREYVFQLWRERKRQLGFEKISDSNFAEILLHRCEDNVEVDESEIYVEDEGEFEYPAFPGDAEQQPIMSTPVRAGRLAARHLEQFQPEQFL
ncbi:hypothetical protein OS493_000465 [Desmophyllum pertusum]|nr:hypothetical protein OS493_000465 [Desmophyllum pertusum]